MILILPKLISIKRKTSGGESSYRRYRPREYISRQESQKAEEALASLGKPEDYRDDYDYMMASANLYRQRQDTVRALSNFCPRRQQCRRTGRSGHRAICAVRTRQRRGP